MAECPDDTPPDVIEESVSNRNYDRNEKKWGERGIIPRWHFSYWDGGRLMGEIEA